MSDTSKCCAGSHGKHTWDCDVGRKGASERPLSDLQRGRMRHRPGSATGRKTQDFMNTENSTAELDQAKNLCSWAAATLESALLGARKCQIEWALTKAETAAKTLRRAKKLMPLNDEASNGKRA